MLAWRSGCRVLRAEQGGAGDDEKSAHLPAERPDGELPAFADVEGGRRGGQGVVEVAGVGDGGEAVQGGDGDGVPATEIDRVAAYARRWAGLCSTC
jgi:hypothetical protein